MTGTNCDLFTHKSSRSYFNHLVFIYYSNVIISFFCEDVLAKFNTFRGPCSLSTLAITDNA
jgi:hypothetical protein